MIHRGVAGGEWAAACRSARYFAVCSFERALGRRLGGADLSSSAEIAMHARAFYCCARLVCVCLSALRELGRTCLQWAARLRRVGGCESLRIAADRGKRPLMGSGMASFVGGRDLKVLAKLSRIRSHSRRPGPSTLKAGIGSVHFPIAAAAATAAAPATRERHLSGSASPSPFYPDLTGPTHPTCRNGPRPAARGEFCNRPPHSAVTMLVWGAGRGGSSRTLRTSTSDRR
jgi:hypothetical protein